MITREQAATEREFHHVSLVQGKGECYRVRRNGATKFWSRRPDWVIPVVFGLRGYGALPDYDAHNWHAASECPRCKPQPVPVPDQAAVLAGLLWVPMCLVPAQPMELALHN